MKFAYQKELHEFVKPSVLCDSDHPMVKATAREIIGEAKTSKALRVRVKIERGAG